MSQEDKPDKDSPRPQGGFCAWLMRFLGCCPLDGERHRRRVGERRTHLANERTFLAWVRTALGLMALGFVVHRFNLFARQLELLGRGDRGARPPASPIHLGLVLIILGSVLGIVAAVRFLVVEHEIETGTYRPSVLFNFSLALVLAAIGLFLAVSLWDVR